MASSQAPREASDENVWAQSDLSPCWATVSKYFLFLLRIIFLIPFAPLQTISFNFDALVSRSLRCCLFDNLQVFHAWLVLGIIHFFFTELYYMIKFIK